MGTVTEDEDYNTLVLKVGYVIPVDGLLIDIGIRYDAIDIDDFADQPITFYGMAVFRL